MTNDQKPCPIQATIESLANDLKPVKCCKNPLWVSFLWAAIAVTYVIAVASMVGLRSNLSDRMTDPLFTFEILLALLTGLAATVATFLLSVPDVRGKSWVLPIPTTLFFVHLLWMFTRMNAEGMGPMPSLAFSYCWVDAALMAGIPAILAVVLVRRGATVRPVFLAFNAVLAMSSFGWIGVRLTCMHDTVGKAYLINYLPYIVLGVAFGLLARRIFRW
jgi:hypothetical protein